MRAEGSPGDGTRMAGRGMGGESVCDVAGKRISARPRLECTPLCQARQEAEGSPLSPCP